MKFDFSNILEVREGVHIANEDRKPGLYYYELRHGEADWTLPVTVEKRAWANYWGIIVCREPILLPENAMEDGSAPYMDLTEEEGKKLSFLTFPSSVYPVNHKTSTITQWMKDNGLIDTTNNRFLTTDYFWDCQCGENYIHPKTEIRCAVCEAEEVDMPPSRINEVIEKLIKEGEGMG